MATRKTTRKKSTRKLAKRRVTHATRRAKAKRSVSKMPVIIRREGAEKGKLSSLVAIFPTIAGSSFNPNTMACYSASEQHSTCSSDYAGKGTKPATKTEARLMLKELSRAGYKTSEMKVVSKATSAHFKARVAKLH